MARMIIDTPTIPEAVYEALPDVLQGACSLFCDPREKDMFLLSTLGALSGCYDKLYGVYHRRRIYANLMIIILAPPASGKGVIASGKSFVQSALSVNSNYNEDNLFIPGNSSAAAIIQFLQRTGNGIIFETEADSVGNAMKQDWGGFSDLYRKAFHHESISSGRARDGGTISRISQPKLSSVITGTPGQLFGIVKSVEDGLFSRTGFYYFTRMPVWKNASPESSGEEIAPILEVMAEKISYTFELLTDPLEFKLTTAQWERFDAHYGKLMQDIGNNPNAHADVLTRNALIAFRLMMTLMAVSLKSQVNVLYCTDEIFDASLKLANVLYEHSLDLIDLMPKTDPAKSNPGNRLLALLPDEFTRQDAIGKMGDLGIRVRTIDYYLQNSLRLKLLTKNSQGKYRKKPV